MKSQTTQISEAFENHLHDDEKIVGISAHQINTEYRKAKTSMVDSANHILTVGRMLVEKKMELGHGNFIPWVETELEFTRFAAAKIMKSYANVESTTHLNETDAIAISRDTWGNNKDVIALKHTGDHESYTPPEYVEAARALMGGISLDPASNDMAQEVIRADSYYTAKDDGLNHQWNGLVFLNPPYEHPLIEQFIDKLIDSHQSGEVKQAILLTNNSADTKWFHKAAQAAKTICFTEGRINFMKQDGTTSSPTNGQAFFYFGNNRNKFAQVFGEFGLVVTVRD